MQRWGLRFTGRLKARPVATLFFFMTLVFAGALAPVQAQEEFQLIRGALQEKFGMRLTLVNGWSWDQVNFTDGIESCIDEGERTGRSAPWGRVYQVDVGNGLIYEVRISFDQEIIIACDNPEHEQLQAQRVEQASVDAGSGAPAEGEPAPAEAPPPPPLPAPVQGAAALSGFALGGHVQDMSGSTFGVMQRAGMTWVKKQVHFTLGDDPNNVGGLIDTAHAHGYRILLSVVGRQDQMGDYDHFINAYAQYVAGVAARGADAIEIWNEPNIDREWPAHFINGAEYTRLLAASYNAIKAANPGTWVISGAPAPTGYFGAAGCGAGGCNDDVFMQQMAVAGAARYLDCVGLHYNEGIIPPSQTSGDPRGSYPTYYFHSMLQRGYSRFGGKPVCFTELGYLSGEGYTTPIPPNFAWANNTTVAQQASWLAQAVTLAARSGRVRLVIVWNVDYRDFTVSDPIGGYAIVRADGSCPACETLAAVMGN